MKNIFGIQIGNRDKQGETGTIGKKTLVVKYVHPRQKKRNSHQDTSSSEVMVKYGDTWDSK